MVNSLAVNGQSFLVIDGYLLDPKKTKNDLTVNSQTNAGFIIFTNNYLTGESCIGLSCNVSVSS